MFNFENQTAIVTGGTRGIGRAISEGFIKAGATVIATYRSNDEEANKFKESLGENSEKLILKKFDVSNFNECQDFFQELENENRKIDILINNSGIRRDNLVALMSEEDWDQVLNTNLKGTFNMTKNAVLHFLSNRYGRIINISSIGGIMGLSGQANYAATKAAQIAMSKSIAKEVARKNITINNVLPGFIETELLDDLDPDLVKEYKKQVPMRKFGKPSDVCHAVMFFASPEASYITGANLEVTGGLS